MNDARTRIRGSEMTDTAIKVTVTFESRPGGGLRVWSDDVPGLVLSHSDVDAVLEDVKSALEVILSERLCASIEVKPLANVREVLEKNGIVSKGSFVPGPKEYVAYCH